MFEWLNAPAALALLGTGGLGSFLGWLGVRATAASQKKSAQIQARDPGWHSFVEEVREEHAEQKAWLVKRIDSQDKRIEEMKAELSTVKATMEQISRLLRMALGVVREFMKHHPDSPVVVPDDLKNEL